MILNIFNDFLHMSLLLALSVKRKKHFCKYYYKNVEIRTFKLQPINDPTFESTQLKNLEYFHIILDKIFGTQSNKVIGNE